LVTANGRQPRAGLKCPRFVFRNPHIGRGLPAIQCPWRAITALFQFVFHDDLIDIQGLIRHKWRVMKITKQATDAVILGELGGRLAKIRLEHNLTQAQLATQAGVSKRTVERLETGAVATQLSGFIRVCRVLDVIERFDLLVPEPVPSPVEQLKMAGRKRQRASTTKPAKPSAKKWQWGDKR
jgi:transcriptional regulator with XRE-family HTH domain